MQATKPEAILSLSQIRYIEQQADAQGLNLMQKAAQVIADTVAQRLPDTTQATILVAAGPGNNGGDALFAALLLADKGYKLDVLLPVAPTSQATQHASTALQQRGISPVSVTNLPSGKYSLIIDGLFGIGLSRPLSNDWLSVIDTLNQLGAPILSVDCPSGMNPYDASFSAHNASIKAAITLTFIAHKPGLLTGAGVNHVGHLQLHELDIPANWLTPAEGCTYSPQEDIHKMQRDNDSHKGSFGTVRLVGASMGMAGAGLLAGRAALKCGAGKVYLHSLDNRLSVDPSTPELMISSYNEPLQSNPTDIFAIGPGLGQTPHSMHLLAALLPLPNPMVLDADALNLVARHPHLQSALQARTEVTILTPHPLEASRLLNLPVSHIQQHRITSAINLARQYQCITILKGAGTIITDGQHYFINTSGSAALASAGQGDVLTGAIAALLAQRIPAYPAAALAVHVHGLTANHYQNQHGGPIGLTASLSADLLPDMINQLLSATVTVHGIC